MRRKLLRYFSRAERLLWGLSAAFIVGSFCAFDRENYLTLAASLIGVTSLIFNAKGNPMGQVLMVLKQNSLHRRTNMGFFIVVMVYD